MTVRLVSALWADYHPFDNLPGISDYACVDNPDELSPGDILISHGGEDISPALYGKGRSYWTGADDEPSQRDTAEWNLMLRARELDIPIIGLCRGAQMLCALNGGILVQHVNGHSGMHKILTRDTQAFNVNSIHHQMQFPWTGRCNHELIAWAKSNLSDVYYGENDEELKVDIEPEFIYYPDCKGFAFQWHPEMMSADTPATKYILQFIKDKLCL